MNLRVEPATPEAAKYAVEHWHYSGKMHGGRRSHYGVWEDEKFIGVVVFGDGASVNLGTQYGLRMGEVVELTRIALTSHRAPVSQIMAEAINRFKINNPRTRLIVSFADPVQNHHGGIYQAANFIYTGTSSPSRQYIVNGKPLHSRTIGVHREHVDKTKHGDILLWIRQNLDPNATTVLTPGKHRYVLPLDRAMRRKVEKLRQPYPQKLAEEASTRRA